MGRYGQNEAAKFLQTIGMTVMAENFRTRRGEVDLIMADGEYVVFVEVKYRRSLRHGYPREAVGISKQKRIRDAALHFISRNQLDQDFRFDVVELYEATDGLTINHIKNAF